MSDTSPTPRLDLACHYGISVEWRAASVRDPSPHERAHAHRVLCQLLTRPEIQPLLHALDPALELEDSVAMLDAGVWLFVYLNAQMPEGWEAVSTDVLRRL